MILRSRKWSNYWSHLPDTINKGTVPIAMNAGKINRYTFCDPPQLGSLIVRVFPRRLLFVHDT